MSYVQIFACLMCRFQHVLCELQSKRARRSARLARFARLHPCANGRHRALFADDMPAAKVVTDMVWAKVGTEIWAKMSWLKSIETMTP